MLKIRPEGNRISIESPTSELEKDRVKAFFNPAGTRRLAQELLDAANAAENTND